MAKPDPIRSPEFPEQLSLTFDWKISDGLNAVLDKAKDDLERSIATRDCPSCEQGHPERCTKGCQDK